MLKTHHFCFTGFEKKKEIKNDNNQIKSFFFFVHRPRLQSCTSRKSWDGDGNSGRSSPELAPNWTFAHFSETRSNETDNKRKEKEKRVELTNLDKPLVFPRIQVPFGAPGQEGFQQQEFRQQIQENLNFPFSNKFEKELVTIIQGAGMTNKWTNRLLGLLGKEINHLHLANVSDIEKSLQKIPIEVSLYLLHKERKKKKNQKNQKKKKKTKKTEKINKRITVPLTFLLIFPRFRENSSFIWKM